MSTPENLNPSEVLVLESQKALGTGSDYNMPHALKCFETALWALEQNEELTKSKKDQLIFFKHILCRNIVINQIKTVGQFKIESPFKNTCSKCRGVGEVYKFRRKSQKVKCMKCVDGKIIQDCSKCGGTGRYTDEIDEGDGPLKINVECRACKGNKIQEDSKNTQVQFKCPTCRGKQKVKKFAIIEEIKSTTPCRYCNELGFRTPKQKSLPANPVMPQTLGEAIKDGEIPPEFDSQSTQAEKLAPSAD